MRRFQPYESQLCLVSCRAQIIVPRIRLKDFDHRSCTHFMDGLGNTSLEIKIVVHHRHDQTPSCILFGQRPDYQRVTKILKRVGRCTGEGLTFSSLTSYLSDNSNNSSITSSLSTSPKWRYRIKASMADTLKSLISIFLVRASLNLSDESMFSKTLDWLTRTKLEI